MYGKKKQIIVVDVKKMLPLILASAASNKAMITYNTANVNNAGTFETDPA